MTDQTASKARSRKTQHNMTTAKMVLFASMMLLYTVHASAQERLAKVYVFATPTQFADQDSKWRAIGVKDLSKELARKKKTLTLVNTRDAADVVIEVTQYGKDTQKNALGVPLDRWVMTATLTAGDYTTTFDSTDPNLGGAGFGLFNSAGPEGDIASAIDRWLKDNRDELAKH